VDIAILVFDGMTVLDAVGPYEVLSRLPSVDVTMVGTERGPKRSDLDSLAIEADALLSETPRPDVVILAGGSCGVELADAVRLSMEYRLEERFGDADPERAPESVRRTAAEQLKQSRSHGRA